MELKNLLKLVWKQKQILPRVQTFAWRLLRRALPTGMRAGRFSIHISQFCSRCGLQEDEFHLFFMCPFARAAWFAAPWFIRTDDLIQGRDSLHSLIIDLLRMQHPYGSITNILNFLWCIWKARNDHLFDRKKHSPSHVYLASLALTVDTDILVTNSADLQDVSKPQAPLDRLPAQGTSLRTDLLVKGPKDFSDAAFKTKKVPGLMQGTSATGIGVYIAWPQLQFEINVQVQASAPLTESPLQAEALALSLAAQLALKLNILHPTFLTDCLTLASSAATGKLQDPSIPWCIRKPLAIYFKHANSMQPQVFHISREVNGIAHNLAHQVFSSSNEPQICCFASAHRHISCPVVALLSNLQVQGFTIHAIHCY